MKDINLFAVEFKKKMMGGLDAEQVYGFMDDLKTKFIALSNEILKLKEQLHHKEMQILANNEKEKLIRDTLASAAHTAEKIKMDAEREAKLIQLDAQRTSEALTQSARESLQQVYHDINEMKKLRLQFETNLRALAQAHLTLLEQGERYIPQTPMSSEVSPLSAF